MSNAKVNIRGDAIRCGRCVFWDAKERKYLSKAFGNCRRQPPTINQESAFPSTAEDEWCGEFRDTWPKEAFGSGIRVD